MGENPIVSAKKRLVAALDKETLSLKKNFELLKTQDEKKVKQFFAHELQMFCSFVDGSKDVVETYFSHQSVPVGLIRAMENYYATLKVILSEFPEVAMDPKLQNAVQGVFLPYHKVLSKMSKVADQYVIQQRTKK